MVWAELGDAFSQYMLGNRYYRGEGVKQNYAEAEKWYQKTAEQENAARSFGCRAYECEVYEEAIKLFSRAAEQEDVTAQYYLGHMYYDGKGVKQDYAEAAKWFLKAAEQGNEDAQKFLGDMYEGGKGVEKNQRKAREYRRLADTHGFARAQSDPSMMRFNWGGKQDAKAAEEWFMSQMTNNSSTLRP